MAEPRHTRCFTARDVSLVAAPPLGALVTAEEYAALAFAILAAHHIEVLEIQMTVPTVYELLLEVVAADDATELAAARVLGWLREWMPLGMLLQIEPKCSHLKERVA